MLNELHFFCSIVWQRPLLLCRPVKLLHSCQEYISTISYNKMLRAITLTYPPLRQLWILLMHNLSQEQQTGVHLERDDPQQTDFTVEVPNACRTGQTNLSDLKTITPAKSLRLIQKKPAQRLPKRKDCQDNLKGKSLGSSSDLIALGQIILGLNWANFVQVLDENFKNKVKSLNFPYC